MDIIVMGLLSMWVVRRISRAILYWLCIVSHSTEILPYLGNCYTLNVIIVIFYWRINILIGKNKAFSNEILTKQTNDKNCNFYSFIILLSGYTLL